MRIADDNRPIKKIFKENGEYWCIGGAWETTQIITRIVPYEEKGEMDTVTWFEVWAGDELKCRVNGKYVLCVCY